VGWRLHGGTPRDRSVLGLANLNLSRLGSPVLGVVRRLTKEDPMRRSQSHSSRRRWPCRPLSPRKYEGLMDPAGKTLTLEGDTPSPFDPAKSVRVREVIELKSPDQKVTTTSLQGEDGSWFKLVTVSARRKK
jgi:hypothetical protein